LHVVALANDDDEVKDDPFSSFATEAISFNVHKALAALAFAPLVEDCPGIDGSCVKLKRWAKKPTAASVTAVSSAIMKRCRKTEKFNQVEILTRVKPFRLQVRDTHGSHGEPDMVATANCSRMDAIEEGSATMVAQTVDSRVEEYCRVLSEGGSRFPFVACGVFAFGPSVREAEPCKEHVNTEQWLPPI
jgi:hypothetical protein